MSCSLLLDNNNCGQKILMDENVFDCWKKVFEVSQVASELFA